MKRTLKGKKYIKIILIVTLIGVFLSLPAGIFASSKSGYTVLTVNVLQKQQGQLDQGGYEYILPYGKYILQEDLTVDGCIDIFKGGTEIYLNGHTIYSTINVYANATISDSEDREGRIIQTKVEWNNKMSYVIYVSRANLTLTNINICKSNVCAVYAVNSNITMNNCNIAYNTATKYAAALQLENSKVTINDSIIQHNTGANNGGTKCAVAMNGSSTLVLNNTELINNTNANKQIYGIDLSDGNQTVKLSGSTVISGNDYGLNAGKGNTVYILDNTKIKDNIVSGLWIKKTGTDGAKICLSNSDDNISVDIDFAEYKGMTASNYLVYFNTNKSQEFITKAFTRDDGGNVAAVLGGNSTYFTVGSDYKVSGNTISCKCESCKKEGSATLVMSDFDDDQMNGYNYGCDLSGLISMEKDNWSDGHILSYPTIIYGYKDGETGQFDDYRTEAPTDPGIYTVKLAILLVKDDVSSEYVSTDEIQFMIMSASECTHENLEYYCEDNNITLRCADCLELFGSANLCTSHGDISACDRQDGRYILYDCCGDEICVELNVIDEEYEEYLEYLEYLTLVYGYYQEDGSIKYSLDAPQEACKFIVCVAALEDDNNPESYIIKTEDYLCEIKYHQWEYSAEDFSLSAECSLCNEEANVYLYSSGADYATRNFDAETSEEYFDYEIFYQDNWINQKGIEQFYVLYDGVAVNDEFNSTLKNNVFYKPTVSGNYSARLVLLDDINDVNSVYLSSDEMPYYLAGVSMGDPYLKITSYSDTQYWQLKAPKIENNAYLVGSFEDLMWVSKYGNLSMDISITNDIVFNPITVTDNGSAIRCGSHVIYEWPGIGAQGEYTGIIYGNGHTIYGLYSKGQSIAGLIINGNSCWITDLTISDAVFSAKDMTGAFVGYYVNEADSVIRDCYALNCVISQIDAEELYHGAGGFIGVYEQRAEYADLILRRDISDCCIYGDWAGGFIGHMEIGGFYADDNRIEMEDCCNKSRVEADIAAGGFVGELDASYNPAYISILKCTNLGDIFGEYHVGGFFGRLYYINGSSVFARNANLGKLTGEKSQYVSEFFGNVLKVEIGTAGDNQSYGNYQLYGFDSWNTSDPGLDLGSSVVSKDVSLEEVVCKNGGLCIFHYKWVQTKASDCENDGELSKICMACGRVLATETIQSHSHNYVYGKCLYCLEKEPEGYSMASVFATADMGIYIMAALVAASVVSVVFVVIVSKKKRIKKN